MNQFESALGLLKKLDRARLLKESKVAEIETASGEDILRLYKFLAKFALTEPSRFGAAFASLKSTLKPVVDSVNIDTSELISALEKESEEHKRKTGEPYPWACEDPLSEFVRQAALVSGIDYQLATETEIWALWPYIVGKLESRYQAKLNDYSESRPPSDWERIFRVEQKNWQRMAGDTVRVVSESRKSQRVHLIDIPAYAETREQRDALANPIRQR